MPLDRERIDALNQAAESMPGFSGDRVACYRKAASDAGFRFLRYTSGDPENIGMSSGPQTEVWERGDAVVNLWTEGDYLGFDDQVD